MYLKNVQLVPLPSYGDGDGWLTPIEAGKDIPFEVKRVYYIYRTKEGVTRGKHAHRKLKQILVAVSGSMNVTCECGGQRKTYCLDAPTKGLLIEGLVWRTMQNFSEHGVLMVLASDYYDEKDYIRNYKDFIEEEKKCN